MEPGTVSRLYFCLLRHTLPWEAMERMDQSMQTARRAHALTMEGRSRARLEGVTAVCCFNEQEVVLSTSEGEVAIFGSGLNIDQLNLDEGRLDVTGEIAGVEYSDLRPGKKRRGLFGRREK